MARKRGNNPKQAPHQAGMPLQQMDQNAAPAPEQDVHTDPLLQQNPQNAPPANPNQPNQNPVDDAALPHWTRWLGPWMNRTRNTKNRVMNMFGPIGIFFVIVGLALAVILICYAVYILRQIYLPSTPAPTKKPTVWVTPRPPITRLSKKLMPGQTTTRSYFQQDGCPLGTVTWDDMCI